jgi:hypothetical protein
MVVERAEKHPPVAPDDEQRWPGNPALLFRVEATPGADDLAARIAKDRERQAQLAAKGFGARRVVHRDGEDAGARGAYRAMELAILRQLAKAERSPVAAEKEKHLGALTREDGQTAAPAGRIGQLEIGRDLAHRGRLGPRRLFFAHRLLSMPWANRMMQKG